jgi:hypothetical protein
MGLAKLMGLGDFHTLLYREAHIPNHNVIPMGFGWESVRPIPNQGPFIPNLAIIPNQSDE